MRFVHLIVALCLFTASFDILLTLHVGATLHIAQALSILVILAAMGRTAQSGRILWPRGGTALLLWIGTQAAFLPLSGVVSIGLQFFALLVLTVACFYAFIQLYGQSARIESFMRLYMASYVFIAVAGLVQFALPLAGLHSLGTRQWIIHGRLGRINGFNYEPSYYATYLMMGWVAMVELRHSGAAIVAGRHWKWATVALTLALVLSTSKTGWAVMLVELLARLGPVLWRALRNTLGQVRRGQMLLPLPSPKTVAWTLLSLTAVFYGVRTAGRYVDPLVLLNGTGIGGTAAHSYNSRAQQAGYTMAEFAENPWVGHSLGGVNVVVGAREGVNVVTLDDAVVHWGFPVLAHVLLASGVFGFIPFLIFLWTYTFGAIRMSYRYWPRERAKWVRALARAMILEWIMLLADQNLLRIYLWFHFAVMAAIMYHLEYTPAPETEAAHPAAPSGLPFVAFAKQVATR